MKKGQIYTGTIEQVAFPNKAKILAAQDADGTVTAQSVTVKGGIAGQTVEFAIQKARRGKYEGKILRVLKKAPSETACPPCPQFGACGGCNYQTLPYASQLALKKEQVLTLLAQHCDLLPDRDFIYDGILPSPRPFAYRNKMEFSFGDEVKDGPLTLGLHKKGSFHDILDAGCCQIVPKDFTQILACVRDYCREKQIPHYKKQTHEGVLRHLLLRRSASTGAVLAALVVSSQQALSLDELKERLLSLPLDGYLSGFLLITNDSLADVVQSDRTDLLYGTDSFTEEILGLRFKISPFSFFQTNTEGAAVLYQRARDYILNSDSFADKTVFDLYSGTGTIAQLIAPVAKKVIGVELVPEAVAAAQENAAANGLSNCTFIAGDVLKVLDEIPEKPDFIILDPPRDGIHPKALKKIIQYGVKNIVYISCKPTSLVRDLAVFLEAGYQTERVSNVDMFPETVHVETVVSLRYQGSGNLESLSGRITTSRNQTIRNSSYARIIPVLTRGTQATPPMICTGNRVIQLE